MITGECSSNKKTRQDDTYGMKTHRGNTDAIVSELDRALNREGGEAAII
jgi:hypothetical protein